MHAVELHLNYTTKIETEHTKVTVALQQVSAFLQSPHSSFVRWHYLVGVLNLDAVGAEGPDKPLAPSSARSSPPVPRRHLRR